VVVVVVSTHRIVFKAYHALDLQGKSGT
jgi:hypothetical protein